MLTTAARRMHSSRIVVFGISVVVVDAVAALRSSETYCLTSLAH